MEEVTDLWHPLSDGGGAPAFVGQALTIQLLTYVIRLHKFIQYLQSLNCAFLTTRDSYLTFCLHPAAVFAFTPQHSPHLFKALLPSCLSLDWSSPVLICAFPPFILFFFLFFFFLREGCRQTRKYKSADECVLLISSRTHISCWRLRSESQRKTHNDSWGANVMLLKFLLT